VEFEFSVQIKSTHSQEEGAWLGFNYLAAYLMYRLKQLLGDRLASRLFETQVTEVHVRIAAMNIMTVLGMLISDRVGTVAP
jgi:hypothetical protein